MGLGILELALIGLLVTGVAFIPWLLALLDVLRSDFQGNGKVAWILVVVLVPVVGFLAYFAFGRSQRRRPARA